MITTVVSPKQKVLVAVVTAAEGVPTDFTTPNNNNNNDRLTAFDPGQPG